MARAVDGFNIETFKSAGLTTGGARPNQFIVTVNLLQDIGGAARKLNFLCRAASIPEMVQDHIDVPYFGRMVKFAGDRRYPDWTVTIMNDEDWLIRRAIEQWQAYQNDPVENDMSAIAYSTAYKMTATVQQYNKDGKTNTQGVYNFVGLFPKEISSTPLDWGQTNTIQEFQVTFGYDYWTILNGNAGGNSGYTVN